MVLGSGLTSSRPLGAGVPATAVYRLGDLHSTCCIDASGALRRPQSALLARPKRRSQAPMQGPSAARAAGAGELRAQPAGREEHRQRHCTRAR